MAAPAIAPRKPVARKPAARKATATTRAQRNDRALAKARATQRSRTAAVPRTAPPARRKSGAAPAKSRSAPAPSPVARVLNSRGMPLVDRVLRGPGWVVMLGALLAGIVFLNVSVLELNRGIARTDAKSADLETVNSRLRARVAKLDNGERIQQLAAAHGFVMPQPGDVSYVRARSSNARLAAERITPPAPPPITPSSTTPTVAAPVAPTATTTATTTPAATTTATTQPTSAPSTTTTTVP